MRFAGPRPTPSARICHSVGGPHATRTSSTVEARRTASHEVLLPSGGRDTCSTRCFQNEWQPADGLRREEPDSPPEFLLLSRFAFA
eukprot:scaffold314167_cov30-Tisochrysis_lutea.AAC.2